VHTQDIEKLLNIQGYRVATVTIEAEKVIVQLEKTEHTYTCPRCGQTSFSYYDKRPVRIRDLPVRGKGTILSMKKHRLYCSPCQAIVTEALSFVGRNRRTTLRYEQFLGALCKEMTLSAVCELTGLHWDTVKAVDRHYIEQYSDTIDWGSITALSIDEVSYKKRHRYFTIITDRTTRRIVHIVESRKTKALAGFFKSLSPDVRHQITLVTMDMWHAYRKAVQKYLPNAKIVYDKFHLIAHLNRAIDQVRVHLQNLCSREHYHVLKGSRWLLLRGKETLSEHHQQRLDNLCRINEPLYRCYLLKEEFRHILTSYRGREGKIKLAEWVRTARAANIKPLEQFVELLLRWYHGIVNYFTHHVTNSLAEGLNNVIKTVIKRGYGFRDLEYLKLKIMQQQIHYAYPH